MPCSDFFALCGVPKWAYFSAERSRPSVRRVIILVLRNETM